MNISIDKEHWHMRVVCINVKKYQFRFGVFRWPWVKFSPRYRTTLEAIVDNGILKWMFYGRYLKTSTHQHGYIRMLCIGIGLGRKLF